MPYLQISERRRGLDSPCADCKSKRVLVTAKPEFAKVLGFKEDEYVCDKCFGDRLEKLLTELGAKVLEEKKPDVPDYFATQLKEEANPDVPGPEEAR